MASRQSTNVSSSQTGNSYPGGQAGSTQVDISISQDVGPTNSTYPNSLYTALNGVSINGSSVGGLQLWADGAVWDGTNSRYLRPGIDFDAALLRQLGR